jgi:hypothetical protein
VDVGGVNPRLHWQISADPHTQTPPDARGLITMATESAEVSLLEGQVEVRAMAEYPTYPDNYAVALAQQAKAPSVLLDRPMTWTRRLLSVHAPEASGMNYLVIRDDMGGFDGRTPSFNCWWFAEAVELSDTNARFKGQFGVDTDLFVAVPEEVKLFTDIFTHDQCEPIVGARHQAKFGEPFQEKQVLCRVEGEPGKGFLVVLFPYHNSDPGPVIEPWLDGRGVKVAWKGETHFIVLDTAEHDVDADGVRARTSALVVKSAGPMNFSASLPAGGEASFRGQTVRGDGPVAVRIAGGKAADVRYVDLIQR